MTFKKDDDASPTSLIKFLVCGNFSKTTQNQNQAGKSFESVISERTQGEPSKPENNRLSTSVERGIRNVYLGNTKSIKGPNFVFVSNFKI